MTTVVGRRPNLFLFFLSLGPSLTDSRRILQFSSLSAPRSPPVPALEHVTAGPVPALPPYPVSLRAEKISELFSDIFKVGKIDKKFDKVSRIEARGEKDNMYLLLDVATTIYPMEEGKSYKIVLASTLKKYDSRDTGHEHYTQASTLADDYEYVMQGKLYRTSEAGHAIVEIHASFGGLLMTLKGDLPNPKFKLDRRLFILVRKV